MHSFYQNFPRRPSWQPMLSMIFFLSKFSPPPLLATGAFNNRASNNAFFLSKFSPPPFLATHAFNDFLFIKIFPAPLLGNPCFQCFSFYQNCHRPPSWQPVHSITKLQIIHSFSQNFPRPPSWQPMLSITELQIIRARQLTPCNLYMSTTCLCTKKQKLLGDRNGSVYWG